MKSTRNVITTLLLILLALSLIACSAGKADSPALSPFERLLGSSSSSLALPQESLLAEIEADYAAYLMEKASCVPGIDGPFFVKIGRAHV